MIYILWRSDSDDKYNTGTVANNEQVMIVTCETMCAVNN